MEITVQGFSEKSLRPEVGRLHATVQAEANTKDDVLAKVTAVVTAFGDELRRLEALDEPPLREVVVRPITTSSWRPVNRGKMQPPIFTANASAQADFTDFAALADIAAAFGATDHLNLTYVEWRLTDETRLAVEAQCVAAAVLAAKDRAATMAKAAGAGDVRFLSVADPGLLGDRSARDLAYGAPASAGLMRSKSAMDVQGIEIAPEDITVSVTVQARFSADEA
ncbi:MAG: SIMPL domain-containing protein [Micropruina sp.]|nr:MAG: SIMPL domain-containing protein [Micropruina sp.]